MSSPSPLSFDFRKCVVADADAERGFTGTPAAAPRLAASLGIDVSTYDLRSNQGGIAVSDKVTLHSDRLYVQARQPMTGSDTGVLFRICEARSDYTCDRNRFASLEPAAPARTLAVLIRRACHV
jgi:hypothetical protein